MEGFGVYGFPKAHGASFAELAYASACMRNHFPTEFFTGVLNSQPMNFYSPRTVLNEARRIGLGILPPGVILSSEGFAVEEGAPRCGWGSRTPMGSSARPSRTTAMAPGRHP